MFYSYFLVNPEVHYFKRKKSCERKKNLQIQKTEPRVAMGSQAAYRVLLNKHDMNVNEYRWKCNLILDGM